jgi:hypothetical protein
VGGVRHRHPQHTLISVVAGLRQRPETTRPNNLPRMQTRGCYCSFRLLMMGGVSPETCWASYKYGIINVDTLLHLVGFLCIKDSILCPLNYSVCIIKTSQTIKEQFRHPLDLHRTPDTVTVFKLSQMRGACSTYVGNVHIVWARKLEVNGLPGRYKCIWEDIIKSYTNKHDTMAWNVFIWSRRRDTWQNTVKTVMNFWVLWNAGNFFTNWWTISFSRWSLFHGVS